LTSRNQNTILISPIGEISPELAEVVARGVESAFGLATETWPVLEDISFALDQNRQQYHSTLILGQLAASIPGHCLRILAITQVDLFIPILTHVYGEAQLGGAASIISTYRLNESGSTLNISPRFIERIVKEAIHELGHTFNLRHCPEHTCIMHYCRNEEDVDRKSDALCRYCRVMVEDEIKRLE
jgi:archaemetzincin